MKSLKLLSEQTLTSAAIGVFPWASAALLAASAGSVVQSSNNLLRLSAIDAPLTASNWLTTILHDLACFMPFLLLLTGFGFLCAFPCAALLAKALPRLRSLIFIIAGAVAFWVANWSTNQLAPVPTLIPATREWPGYLAMVATGGLGGWLFVKIYPRPLFLRKTWQMVVLLFLPLVFLAAGFGTHKLMQPDRAEPIHEYELVNARVNVLVDGLVHPWSMVLLPDGRKLITERAGRMRIISAEGRLLETPVSGVPEVLAGGQGGLMDIKASPHFQQDHLIFFTYACGTSDANNTCVGRGELRGNALTDVRQIFQAKPLKYASLQFGSRITVLPDDTLLFSVGDGFDFREQAQDLQNHFGKVIRLNMDGSVPDDNPFVGQQNRLPEIYSYGHRNPQGIWYDPVREQVFMSEHGPFGGDEVNRIKPGQNYGWPLTIYGINYAGDRVSPFQTLPRVEDPLHHWTPSIAPSDISVYRGEMFPELEGDLLVAALGGQGVFRLKLDSEQVAGSERLFHRLRKRIRQVVAGPKGEIYLLTDHDPGQVLLVSRKDF